MARLVYPENIKESTDYIKFEFGTYASPFKAAPGGSAVTGYNNTIEAFSVSGDPIYLPMPNDIGSAFQGNWGGKEVTGVAQIALSTAVAGGDILKGDFAAAKTQFTGLFTKDTVKDVAGGGLQDLLRTLGDGFSQLPGMGANLTANEVLQLTTESIVNPNTELLYSGTGLRTHGYSFKLIPRSDTEGATIMQIVERFKKACAPKGNVEIFGDTFRNFIGIPDLCKVSFIGSGGGENTNLPRYKTSAITSVNVGYVTDGQYVSYRDGRPLGVSLSVSLMETKLVFSEEIGSGANQYR